MNAKEHDLESLAVRASRGDVQAKITFRQVFEPSLVHMVRLSLRTGQGPGPLARRALAEAQRLTGVAGAPQGDVSEHLVAKVVRRVCDGVMANMAAKPAPRHWSTDTVPAA
jgi:hypothetical protein